MMQVRYIQQIGIRASRRIYWGDDCPNCLGFGNVGYHNAQTHIEDLPPGPWPKSEDPSVYSDGWPARCDHCGTLAPEEVSRQIFHSRLYDTASGRPEPGTIYFLDFHKSSSCWFWDNCPGPHLVCVLPNGHDWDIDSRASNCTMLQDKTHRCWIRHGEPPAITVDKSGHTCAAGAGSIDVPGWHGFLRIGQLVLA